MNDWAGLAWLVVLLIANAFFVGAEFAVISARRSQIEPLAEQGRRSAKTALWAMEQGMAGAVGLSNKTDFLRATTEGALVGRATPIHRGRTQQLWQVDVTRDSDGKLVAQGQVRLQNVTSTEF